MSVAGQTACVGACAPLEGLEEEETPAAGDGAATMSADLTAAPGPSVAHPDQVSSPGKLPSKVPSQAPRKVLVLRRRSRASGGLG
jgi:hypothetical protein